MDYTKSNSLSLQHLNNESIHFKLKTVTKQKSTLYQIEISEYLTLLTKSGVLKQIVTLYL